VKSQYLLCYFLSFLDLQRILKHKQKNLNKLRDIALFKLTMMSLELCKFDNMIDRLMHFIKTNHSLRAKTISRRHRHSRYFLTNTVHNEVLNFLGKEIGQYIEDESQAKLEAAQDSIVRYIFKLIFSQSSLKTPNSKALAKNKSSANDLPDRPLKDRTIPEEKDTPITLPNFNMRHTLMMMAEPEPEHMFVPGSFYHKPSTSEAHSIPLFKTHRNANRMQMLPTTLSHFEEVEVPSSKRHLDFEVDFPKAGRDYSFESTPQNMSQAGSSSLSEHGPNSEQNKQRRSEKLHPTKLSLTQKSILSPSRSPKATIKPRKTLFTPLHTLSEDYFVHNKVDQIEEMLENYFDVNLEEVRGVLVSSAPKGSRLHVTNSNPTFSDCLLEYLENKEIIEMEDLVNFLDYSPSLKSDDSGEEGDQRVASADRSRRKTFWTCLWTPPSTAKTSRPTPTTSSQAGASLRRRTRPGPPPETRASMKSTATFDSSP
jgi:hypothetical protein